MREYSHVLLSVMGGGSCCCCCRQRQPQHAPVRENTKLPVTSVACMCGHLSFCQQAADTCKLSQCSAPALCCLLAAGVCWLGSMPQATTPTIEHMHLAADRAAQCQRGLSAIAVLLISLADDVCHDAWRMPRLLFWSCTNTAHTLHAKNMTMGPPVQCGAKQHLALGPMHSWCKTRSWALGHGAISCM
jgi:hypothetical protein